MNYSEVANQVNFYHDNRLAIPLDSGNVTKPTDNGLRLGLYTYYGDCIFIATHTIIASLGFFLNLLAIIAISTGKKTSKEIKIQLINLAAADIISALVFPGYMLHFELKLPFPPSIVFCGIVLFIGKGAFYTSLLWNMAISIERFFIVYFPFKAAGYTRQHKLMVAAAVWTCGLLVTLEIAIYASLTAIKGVVLCVVDSPLLKMYPVIYEFRATIKISIPAIIIVVMYSLIAIKLARRKYIGETVKSGPTDAKMRQRNKQILRMLAIDAGLTLMLWIPYNVAYVVTEAIGISSYNRKESMLLTCVLGGLLLANCFKSPVVYYLFNSSFREDTHNLFRRVCGKKANEDGRARGSQGLDQAASTANSRTGTKAAPTSVTTISSSKQPAS